mmetsp:Transcript_25203/g.34854  ORF Transcript_25203/g.34854 Transcript_25203/m.34854 type:complete len:147 (+) Transcript_25203:1972-2412(+)
MTSPCHVTLSKVNAPFHAIRTLNFFLVKHFVNLPHLFFQRSTFLSQKIDNWFHITVPSLPILVPSTERQFNSTILFIKPSSIVPQVAQTIQAQWEWSRSRSLYSILVQRREESCTMLVGISPAIVFPLRSNCSRAEKRPIDDEKVP